MSRLVWSCVLLFSLLSGRLAAQVVPATDLPDDPTSDTPAQTAAVPLVRQPVAAILGWSFKDELEGQPLQRAEALTLDAGHPELILFFDAANARNQPVVFRYRLAGYDPDWTLTRAHNAHYRRLPPGRYRFEVQARLRDQPWATTAAFLSVEQRPFFYQTWYAAVMVALLLAGLAVHLLHQRDQLLKGQIAMVLEERNRIASDCHDTLMAGFAAIHWQLESTRQLLSTSDGVGAKAAQSCELARSMVSHCQTEARRIIWDLRSPDGITDLLSEGLAGAIEAHRAHGTIPTVLHVEGDEVPISPGAVHHLVCICQEAINNALRHANPTRIEVFLRFFGETLGLAVRDNGRGFPSSEAQVRTGHFGISVMEERARKLGGTLRIQSSSEAGTEVLVTVNYTREYQPMIPQQPHVLPWIGV